MIDIRVNKHSEHHIFIWNTLKQQQQQQQQQQRKKQKKGHENSNYHANKVKSYISIWFTVYYSVKAPWQKYSKSPNLRFTSMSYWFILFNFFFVPSYLIGWINSYFHRKAFWGTCFLLASNTWRHNFTRMELHTLARSKSDRKSLKKSIIRRKEWLLCHKILIMRRISNLYSK